MIFLFSLQVDSKLQATAMMHNKSIDSLIDIKEIYLEREIMN